MLTITVSTTESFNEATNEFVTDSFVLELEHSLASLSKWESEFKKPFLGAGPKTSEETLAYIRAMTLTPNVTPEMYHYLSDDNIRAIDAYVNDKQTATWFTERGPQKPNRETITSELIYYWMLSLQIDKACEHWHLNRLLTLIQVVSKKNAPQKKMSRREIAQRNSQLNAERKARLGTRG